MNCWSRTWLVAGWLLATAAGWVAASDLTGSQEPVDPRVLPETRVAAPVPLIPYPRMVEWHGQRVAIKGAEIAWPAPPGAEHAGIAREIKNELTELTGAADRGASLRIRLALGAVDGAPADNREAYSLVVTNDRIDLQAMEWAGLFHGVQTLRQLAKSGAAGVPTCRIIDWPAFALRGFMLDTGRNYQTPAFVKRQIALAAAYKFNTFHWHLTDDPGFRIESKAFPALNKPASHTRNPGKFYSYDQIREIQAYAAARNVEIIPEIDIPGHSAYFKRALGFDMQSPQGADALSRIFREFCDEVKTRYVHIGSDEVNIRDKNLIPDIARLLQEQGRQVICWRPGGPLPAQAITQGWLTRWNECEPMKDVPHIDSAPFYVNTTWPTELHRWFFAQPCGAADGSPLRLGAIACAWPDTRVDDESMTLRIMPLVPALITFGERSWRGAGKDRRDLGAVPPPPGSWEARAFGLFERDLLAHQARLAKQWPFPYVRHLDLSWELLGPIPGTPRTVIDESPASLPTDLAVEGKSYAWHGPYHGGTVNLQFWRGYDGLFQKSPLGTTYARAGWNCDADREVELWVQFDLKHGNSRGAANPERGRWSTGDARLWINGQAVPGPDWKLPGTVKDSLEVPLVDECFFYRKPVKVRLRKGHNTILLRVPSTGGKTGNISSFTCIPVVTEANGAVRRSDRARCAGAGS